MEIKDFISKLDSVFENTDLSTFTYDTKFRELEEWDSMLALSFIAMADDSYNVKVTGADVRNANTIGDLFEMVKGKLTAA